MTKPMLGPVPAQAGLRMYVAANATTEHSEKRPGKNRQPKQKTNPQKKIGRQPQTSAPRGGQPRTTPVKLRSLGVSSGVSLD